MAFNLPKTLQENMEYTELELRQRGLVKLSWNYGVDGLMFGVDNERYMLLKQNDKYS